MTAASSSRPQVNPAVDRSMPTVDKYLVLGAGFIGLAIAQGLKAAGIPYDQVDASDDIGGNWYHGVYSTAHIISSRRITEFRHFPMPADYPDFPSAAQMRDYLHQFADRFDLRAAIELNQTVTRVVPIAQNRWRVTFASGESRVYRGVLLCNGHHWCKRFPEFSGEFTGEILHSKDYKHPDQLRGRRVLVIGGGNSGCDIASEAARVGSHCTLSLRDTVWFIPKTFLGIPTADLIRWWMPDWFQRRMAHLIMRLTFGRHQDYGMPTPRHRVFAKHPTLNDEVPYYLKHGRIQYKPAIARLDGQTVEFSDRTRQSFDLIVCATGYHLAYPFLPPELQRVRGAILNCYGGSSLADYQGLHFIGWGQARGGVGSLMSAYTPLFVRLLQLETELQVPLGLVFKDMGQSLPTTHLSDPQAVFRRLALLNRGFSYFSWRARQIAARYPDWHNQPLDSASPVTSLSSGSHRE